jgi:hypothetical protein
MKHSEQMKAVEDRVFALRLTMTDALQVAKVAHSTWSRAKSRGYIRARTLGRVEDAVAYLEKQQASEPRAGQA